MAASRVQTPVNLKERIAALQQRSVSPNTHQSAQATPRGLPSPGSKSGLRDKIAKFEEKGGVPVPRGSFGMGAPQLAENAPSKKRGELYGNRVPGLGRPSGPPNMPSRAGSPCATGAEDGAGASAPRKRCISTGATLSSGAPGTFSTDEPVPALPNGLVGTQPRRNSLAVNFGSGRRTVSTSDAESAVVDIVDASSSSSSSPLLEKPPELADPSSASPTGEPESPLEATEHEDTPENAELLPVVEELSLPPASQADTPPEDQHPSPVSEVSQSRTKESLSDYESAPQSAGSHPASSLPEPVSATTPPSVLADTLSDVPQSTSVSAEAVAVSPPTPPPSINKPTSRVNTINIHVPSLAAPVPPSIPSPILTTEVPTQGKSTFKAVVHRKVTELPIAPTPSNLAPPATLQVTKQRRVSGKVIDVSASPNYGDLAVLLEDAALLELRLTEGDSRMKDLAKTPTNATFEQDTRHASASTLTEHAPIASVGSGSLSGRSMSIPSIREPLDGDIPEEEETDGRSLASTTFSGRSLSQRKYLANIYRLGRRSSSYMPGAYPRDSMSLSSEDSSPVATPSDHGRRKGFGIAWPGSSPNSKKGSPTVSRSSSFADKIFHRNRTRSNVSTADQMSERGSLYESQPSLSLSFHAELSAESHPGEVDVGARPTSWISTGDSNPEFSPASSFLDKDIFDAFPSVPQTLPPGFHLDADHGGVGRASTLPVNGRKQVSQRLSMV